MNATMKGSRWRELADAIAAVASLFCQENAHEPLAPPPLLARLAAKFHLTNFERDLVLLCAAVELDGTLAARVTPTFELAFELLAEPHWSAASTSGPLRRYQLLEVSGGASLMRSSLRLDDRILDYLAGAPGRDPRLSPFVEPCTAPTLSCTSHRAVADQITDALRREPATILLSGDDPAAKRAVATTAASRLGLELYVLKPDVDALSVIDRDRLCCLWEREAKLVDAALMIELDDADLDAGTRAARILAEQLPAPMFISVRDPILLRCVITCTCDVGRPSTVEQRQLWISALPVLASPEHALSVDRMISNFQFGVGAIEAIAHEARKATNPVPKLWEACRARGRKALTDLGERITPRAHWDDLILPDEPRRRLTEIVIQVRHRKTVYESWGFASKSGRGLGISALFSGQSGTGKTMAAEVLAGALDADLYRIDLSRVVSKYIGETEKNLRRIFDAADESGTILLFDEADALFGKRTEVRDSHDRHANIEVSYLLARMESYRGLAILTTNMRDAIDIAFLRRLRFIIDFPFPSEDLRRDIWQRVWPDLMPSEALDTCKLARLQLTGGNIRNIALHAAFLAADARQPLTMAHVLSAAQAEHSKLQKPFNHAQVADWV